MSLCLKNKAKTYSTLKRNKTKKASSKMVHMVCYHFYNIVKTDINLDDSTQNSVEMNDWRQLLILTPVIPAFGRLGQADSELKGSLFYPERSCVLKKSK